VLARAGPLVTVVIVVAALGLGREVLIPGCLAALFTILLAPLADLLRRRLRLPHLAAVLVAFGAGGLVVLALLVAVTLQVVDLAQRLPEYRENVRTKLRVIQGITRDIRKVSEDLAELDGAEEAEPPAGGKAAPSPPAGPTEDAEPQPVRIAPPEPSTWSLLERYGSALGAPLSTVSIVLVLTLFMLLYRADLRERLVAVLGHGEVTVTAQAFDEGTALVGRYLLTTLAVNAAYGVPLGLGLAWIGVPGAFLWGLLATLLRFIPFVGPLVAAVIPIALSFAVFDAWTPVLLVAGLFLVLELISNNLVEPWLYGVRTGLSPVAVLVAAVFWTWLWGLPGLFLAVPLTVGLAVAGRYVPELGALHILLSRHPALDPATRLYHGWLSRRGAPPSRVVAEELEDAGPAAACDLVLLPALALARAAARRGHLAPVRIERIREGLRNEMEALRARAEDARPEPRGAPPVVALTCGDEDEGLGLAALDLALAQEGYATRALAPSTLVGEAFDAIQEEEAQVAVVFALPPDAGARLARRVRRLRARFPDLRIVAVPWSPANGPASGAEGLVDAGANAVVTSVGDAVESVGARGRPAAPAGARAAR
jgi:predicted PurR-regulated permease PerM